ncbi:MAG: CehA/McbA family metallohydrolase [Pirellulales bacterium]
MNSPHPRRPFPWRLSLSRPSLPSWANRALLLIGLLAIGLLLIGGPLAQELRSAEIVQLTPDNWSRYAPAGKEVDAIHGDIVLANDRLIAVIGQPVPGRHANMTVRNVGGALIDFTSRQRPNDQLSAYYPLAQGVTPAGTRLSGLAESVAPIEARQANEVSYACRTTAVAGEPQITVTYSLNDVDPWLSIETTYHNPHDQPLEWQPTDSLRADRSFVFDLGPRDQWLVAHDSWWRQAYVIWPDGASITPVQTTWEELRPVFRYRRGGSDGTSIELSPGATYSLRRRMLVGKTQLEMTGQVAQAEGLMVLQQEFVIRDADGPVPLALVTVRRDGQTIGSGRTDDEGHLSAALAAGPCTVYVRSQGRPDLVRKLDIAAAGQIELEMQPAGYLELQVVDDRQQAIACKVELQPLDGELPHFGPDSFVYGVQNLQYSPHGDVRAPLSAGKYRVIVSHGCEFDAVITEAEVQAGKTTRLPVTLRRVVNTPGWISADFHSHSTPSGDNTSSQDGRVLNLLAEQIEFAPCTEHNRITDYLPSLTQLRAVGHMATCPGMELTGSPLPINHQNAFPLIPHPHTQDGGGPVADENPEVQIERLAMWDRSAEKLVQVNHPHLHQMFGDRDLNGKADPGFRRMFRFMDVVEIHPLDQVLLAPDPEAWRKARGNVVRNWMQLLNLGYRIPGVVNTDAHYNFHGSGWLRNYIRSETDNPALIDPLEIVRAAERGQMVMTNGPFLQVEVEGRNEQDKTVAGPVGPGDDLVLPAEARRQVRCTVSVKCANWLDVNRVMVLVNGRVDPQLDFRRAAAPRHFAEGVVRFQATLPVTLQRDAHLIAVAAGEGLGLGPVVGPEHRCDQPMAIANPIFVDIDGDGFNVSKDLLDMPLPGADPAPGAP